MKSLYVALIVVALTSCARQQPLPLATNTQPAPVNAAHASLLADQQRVAEQQRISDAQIATEKQQAIERAREQERLYAERIAKESRLAEEQRVAEEKRLAQSEERGRTAAENARRETEGYGPAGRRGAAGQTHSSRATWQCRRCGAGGVITGAWVIGRKCPSCGGSVTLRGGGIERGLGGGGFTGNR
jgi:rubrerythrin